MREETREVLLDILKNHEALEKITVTTDGIIFRTVTITIEHLDGEWFRELQESLKTPFLEGVLKGGGE